MNAEERQEHLCPRRSLVQQPSTFSSAWLRPSIPSAAFPLILSLPQPFRGRVEGPYRSAVEGRLPFAVPPYFVTLTTAELPLLPLASEATACSE